MHWIAFRGARVDRWRQNLPEEQVEAYLRRSEAVERDAEARGDYETARGERNSQAWLLKGRH